MCSTNSLKYYECAIIGTSKVFTYEGGEFLPFDIVLVPLKSNTKKAIILKEIKKPSFECKSIILLEYRPTNKEIEYINKTFLSFLGFKNFDDFKEKNQKVYDLIESITDIEGNKIIALNKTIRFGENIT